MKRFNLFRDIQKNETSMSNVICHYNYIINNHKNANSTTINSLSHLMSMIGVRNACKITAHHEMSPLLEAVAMNHAQMNRYSIFRDKFLESQSRNLGDALDVTTYLRSLDYITEDHDELNAYFELTVILSDSTNDYNRVDEIAAKFKCFFHVNTTEL